MSKSSQYFAKYLINLFKMTRVFNGLPKWRNFAKSGHTERSFKEEVGHRDRLCTSRNLYDANPKLPAGDRRYKWFQDRWDSNPKRGLYPPTPSLLYLFSLFTFLHLFFHSDSFPLTFCTNALSLCQFPLVLQYFFSFYYLYSICVIFY